MGKKSAQKGVDSHRRKSSERVVTNEGQRKAIRDFNVFEMSHRRKATVSTAK